MIFMRKHIIPFQSFYKQNTDDKYRRQKDDN